jgi:hypothetical protein
MWVERHAAVCSQRFNGAVEQYSPWYPAFKAWARLFQELRGAEILLPPGNHVTFDAPTNSLCGRWVVLEQAHYTTLAAAEEMQRTVQVVDLLVQELTDTDQPACWLDVDQGQLLSGLTPLASLDLGWSTDSRRTADGSWEVVGGAGFGVALHVLVLSFAVADLTLWTVAHTDGDASNFRRDNLAVTASPPGASQLVSVGWTSRRQLQVRMRGGQRVCSLVRRGDDDPHGWATLGRLLRRLPAPWADNRGNVLGLLPP